MRDLLAWIIIVAVIIVVSTTPHWLGPVLVWLMRNLRIYLFPNAIRIAISIEKDEEWYVEDAATITHPIIGQIDFPLRSAVGVKLKGTNRHRDIRWKPSWLERIIIYDAAKALVRERREEFLDRVLK